jgi:hypothetical protein
MKPLAGCLHGPNGGNLRPRGTIACSIPRGAAVMP